jgi:hypothetical protein
MTGRPVMASPTEEFEELRPATKRSWQAPVAGGVPVDHGHEDLD